MTDIKYWDKKCPKCGADTSKLLYTGKNFNEDTLFECSGCECIFEVGEWGIMNCSRVWIRDRAQS